MKIRRPFCSQIYDKEIAEGIKPETGESISALDAVWDKAIGECIRINCQKAVDNTDTANPLIQAALTMKGLKRG